MADIYVRSTDGSDADDGSTWALAKATLTGAAAIDAAGDTIYVSDAHAESTAASVTIALAGTHTSPTKVICGDDVAEPPTAVAASATVTTTGASALTITGSAYLYGLSFAVGSSGSSGCHFNLGSTQGIQVYKSCTFTAVSANAVNFNIGSVNAQYAGLAEFVDCDFVFASNAAHKMVCYNRVIFKGCAFTKSGFTGPLFLAFDASGESAGVVTIDGCDFSALGATFSIFSAPTVSGNGVAVVRNCKLPASWTGTLMSGSLSYMGHRFEMYNCDDGDTNYRLWVEDYTGSVKSETTVVRTGGASDGTTALSWKMTSSANAEYPLIVLRAPEIVIWNDTTGSAITVTIEVITDNVTLTNAEAWIEAQYLGTSGFPVSTFIDDAKADVLATAANQTTSSETWTTTGLATPVKQKLSVTFTPQEKGFVHITPCLAKASTTMYVCPKPDVT